MFELKKKYVKIGENERCVHIKEEKRKCVKIQ